MTMINIHRCHFCWLFDLSFVKLSLVLVSQFLFHTKRWVYVGNRFWKNFSSKYSNMYHSFIFFELSLISIIVWMLSTWTSYFTVFFRRKDVQSRKTLSYTFSTLQTAVHLLSIGEIDSNGELCFFSNIEEMFRANGVIEMLHRQANI